MNNFEKITENLTPKKLAELINLSDDDICRMCIFDNNCVSNGISCAEGIEQWLLKEVQND